MKILVVEKTVQLDMTLWTFQMYVFRTTVEIDKINEKKKPSFCFFPDEPVVDVEENVGEENYYN